MVSLHSAPSSQHSVAGYWSTQPMQSIPGMFQPFFDGIGQCLLYLPLCKTMEGSVETVEKS